MRTSLIICLLVFIQYSCSQDFVEGKEIAKTLKFEAINDTVNGIYYDTAIFHDKERTIVIVNKQDTTSKYEQESNETEQIFVLQRIGEKFEIIDSSTLFDRDGRGPQVSFENDTLRVENNHHHGGYTLSYIFNMQSKKYKLTLIESQNLLFEDKEYNNQSTGIEVQSYNVVKQELTIKNYEFDESNNEKLKTTRTVKRKIPEKFIPDLAHFIDPEGGETDVYDKIFQ